MAESKMIQIWVDEEVYDFLKRHAEPFKNPPDSPNSILRRFLPLGTNKADNQGLPNKREVPTLPASTPEALTQILEMVFLVKGGLSRTKATRLVAEMNRVAIPTVIDKYTRQLGKRAAEIDEFITDAKLHDFKTLLIERFPYHVETIENAFKELMG